MPEAHNLPTIALTAGEPAGIGPEIVTMLATEEWRATVVIIGDRELIRVRAAAVGRDIRLPDYAVEAALPPVSVLHTPLAVPAKPGQLDPANARYVLDTLNLAIDGCLAGRFDAMVTAPVHKGVINDAGVAFTGHTEYLAQRTSTPQVVMMLVGGNLRVALATTHLPLTGVPEAITRDGLIATLRVVHHDLRTRFSIADPRILVAGLNPHAGESGHLGREEIDVIAPAVAALAREGMRVTGPLPADTLFTPGKLKEADCVLAMYHDQGLPVLKHASFGAAVNVTLGLPFIRTSVDHGTALDIAGTGRAESGSLRAALLLAIDLATRRR
jgi:4-hydroxythreonine-4-phosphate dehydrogenase